MRTKSPYVLFLVLPVVLIALSFTSGAWAKPKYKVLHDFTGGNDGSGPYGSLIFDQQGNLYGTTAGGGTDQKCTGGCGTVFELTPETNGKWSETVLHSFQWDGRDGYDPTGNVILDAAGNLYGTATAGGLYNHGMAFELEPQTKGWKETVLYSFCAQPQCSDGGSPAGWFGYGRGGQLVWDGWGSLSS